MKRWHGLIGSQTTLITMRRRPVASCGLPGFLLIALMIALMIAGCGATTAHPIVSERPTPANTPTPTPNQSGSSVDRVVPALALRNPAATMLDISLSLTFDQLSGATQSMTEVGLSFMCGGRSVQFTGDERVSCNGVDYPLTNRAAVFRALRAPTAQVSGTTLRCT
jgi:hypothetical protein